MSRPATRFTTLHAKLCITMCDETPRSVPTDNLRRFLHGVVNLGRTGISWRDLLPRFGHWNSIFYRFRR
ncbi:MAG: transposase [Caldilineaceae bacterium SB0665_bin_21]|nr:transposase [Caldilineaceae bacterium SB0665_bin_21]MYC63591.1 transposase [Caldilineaceae bacterium SB0661_bin_34]